MTEMVLTDFLDRAVQIYGDKRAIIDQNDNVYTYKDVNDRVNQLSHGLHSFGVQKGDRVAYLAPNTLEMYEGFYGIFQLGAVMVSLNTRLKSDDYLYILNHSESRVLFVDHELYSLVEPIIPKLEHVQTIVVHGAERSSGAYYSYDDWLATQPKEPFQRAEVSENDMCSLLYTSGTTGKPKGHAHSPEQLLARTFVYAPSTCERRRYVDSYFANVPCEWLGLAILLYSERGNASDAKEN